MLYTLSEFIFFRFTILIIGGKPEICRVQAGRLRKIKFIGYKVSQAVFPSSYPVRVGARKER